MNNETHTLEKPTLASTANGNLEAQSFVTWLQSHGVRAYAMEDNSGVSLYAFGTISQFHKPQVFVGKHDLESASELLRQFERRCDERRRESEDQPPIESEREECGVSSKSPASQNGTTQNCPHCNAFMDVGDDGWPEEFDFGEDDATEKQYATADDAIDAAARVEKSVIGVMQFKPTRTLQIISRNTRTMPQTALLPCNTRSTMPTCGKLHAPRVRDSGCNRFSVCHAFPPVSFRPPCKSMIMGDLNPYQPVADELGGQPAAELHYPGGAPMSAPIRQRDDSIAMVFWNCRDGGNWISALLPSIVG